VYLLDTNVISELRKGDKADAQLRKWAGNTSPTHLFISAITVLELEQGVLQKERRDSKQGALLRSWLTTHVLPAFSNRVLPVDTAVAQQCARLHVPDPRSERDALIGATAIVHGLTLVTRNTQDFALMDGLALFNPWE
jgi:predicted nucleic acid-binding protein